MPGGVGPEQALRRAVKDETNLDVIVERRSCRIVSGRLRGPMEPMAYRTYAGKAVAPRSRATTARSHRLRRAAAAVSPIDERLYRPLHLREGAAEVLVGRVGSEEIGRREGRADAHAQRPRNPREEGQRRAQPEPRERSAAPTRSARGP